MSKTQKLRVNGIRIDGGTQPRALINDDIVSEYAGDLMNGVVFPPVIVFHDGDNYWLADGFHRLHAHKKVELKTIECEVRKGSLRDAVLHACGSNQTHGLRRSQADKRQAVILLLDDAEWNAWSDRKIATACGVSHTFVGAVRKEWAKDLSVNVARCAEVRTVQRGDQNYEMDTENIGLSPQTALDEEAEVDEPAEGNGEPEEELRVFKPPAKRKKPKTRFDDREIDDAIGILIRKFDERARIHGKSSQHQVCIDSMGDVLRCWKIWRSGK